MPKILSCVLLMLMGSASAMAETVEFSDEELATETVLPRFEVTRVVLNRYVETSGKFELGGGLGLALNEPFYNPLQFHLTGTYHFNDLHAFNLWGSFFSSGLSQYGRQLQAGEGLTSGESFDPSHAPAPTFMLLGNYQINAYYGKISLTKQAVGNLSLFGTAGIGALQTGSVTNFAANFGFGQNFYMGKNVALRLDFRFLVYNGPDATSAPAGGLKREQPDREPGYFTNEWFLKTFVNLGVVFLL